MKKWLIAVLMLVSMNLKAQTSPVPAPVTSSPGVGVPVANLNLASVSSILREDFAYDQHGVKWFGLHIPLLDYHDTAGDEIVNLNEGLMWAGAVNPQSTVSAGAPSGFNTSISLRLDYLLKKANGTHLTTPILPKIEIGPMGGYITAQREWIYGFQVSTTFGQ